VKRSYLGAVLLWVAVVVVVGMILFPQEIAGFIADRMVSRGNQFCGAPGVLGKP
jgi:hypothetical protein